MQSASEVTERWRLLGEGIDRVVMGQEEVKEQLLVCLLAGGHALLEGVPGTAKTLLALTLSRLLGCRFRRIQFTPDLMPADLLGTSIFNQKSQEFEFHPGPIFADLLLADEVNRTPPRTQAALLEAMQEKAATMDGVRRDISPVFTVLATQNPVEFEGTYPLPEAQRDRFTARVSMGYPDREAELALLDDVVTTDPLTTLTPATDAAGVRALVAAVGRLHVSEAVRRYVVALVEATRRSPDLRLGASPRAGLQLLRTARATAALAGRDHVLPDDVQTVAVPVLAHRLLLSPDAAASRRTAEQVVGDLLRTVPVPRGR
jgi:MoxR-like ATPase